MPSVSKAKTATAGLITRIERIMVSYELSNETGWQSIPGGTHTIVAHFRDGHKEKMSLVDFLVMGRKRNQVKRIDCYEEGEEIK